MKNWLWFFDAFAPSEIHLHGYTYHLLSKKTKYQELDIIESPFYGRMLLLDGDVQSGLKDEYIYHEALVHPAMLLHPNPEKVWILGGGEGATAREILKHKTVKELYMVDIDPEMVDAAREHLKEWHQGAFDDPRMHLIIDDAKKVVEQLPSGAANVIISDLTEPYDMGPSFPLFTKQFMKTIYDRLDDHGVYVLQASILRPLIYDMHATIRRTLKTVFPVVRSFAIYVGAFDTPWSFIVASKDKDPLSWSSEELDAAIKDRINGELKMYDSEAHWHMFYLPKDLRKVIDEEGPILDEDNPIALTPKGQMLPS